MVENIRNQILGVDTSNVLLSPSRLRTEIIITNTSAAAQVITISLGEPAVANKGVVLGPYAVYYASNTQGFQVYTGEIFAIGSAINGQVSIFER
jgi:hypothetical protein